ncbi:hypothetical protein MRB53_007994 [Persea americana]|uniref:Uncharacterized protein n=1 Tax=Persea americana TaxID=3435 RepID=A0ACC2MKU4_PERAE|nr:hypothetical protein MRB53_007994 [Persea americana]
MADLFHTQAKLYAETRPGYPTELFHFISSKTPNHQLTWDVGTGSGQAAVTLAGIYKNVVATDTSMKQISFASKLPNIRYQHTPPTMSIPELEHNIAPQGTVDLVTVAQAFHWFDHPAFFEQVKWILRRPNGVLALWCYINPRIDESIDAVFNGYYAKSAPFWDPARRLVEQEYRSIDFPFEPVEGTDHTGPFEFEEKKLMNLDAYLTYLRSSSAYQTAKEKGVELLGDELIEEFENAWGEDKESPKVSVLDPNAKAGNTGLHADLNFYGRSLGRTMDSPVPCAYKELSLLVPHLHFYGRKPQPWKIDHMN